MDDLTAKIRAEIDTDVRLANGEDEQAHNERHWPDRIERQAAAFRLLLDLALNLRAAYQDDPCNGARQNDNATASDILGALRDVYEIKHP